MKWNCLLALPLVVALVVAQRPLEQVGDDDDSAIESLSFDINDDVEELPQFGVSRLKRQNNRKKKDSRDRCKDPGSVKNASRGGDKPDAKKRYKHGSVLVYKCKSGFALHGNNSITCQRGVWSSKIPRCKRGKVSTCIDPGNPTNGKRVGPEATEKAGRSGETYLAFNEGDVLEFTCNEDFVIKGSETRTCSNGAWSGAPTSCMVKYQTRFDGTYRTGLDDNVWWDETFEFSNIARTGL